MHLHHDHCGGVEHTHEYTHTHPHDHEHDHHVHDHGDEHEHSHSYTHTHEHGDEPHTHEHPQDHEHCGHDCGSCGEHCEHTPMEELLALMQYMVVHNGSPARELADLAKQLEDMGQHTAYEQVMQAVSDFEKGNLRLQTVLTALKA